MKKRICLLAITLALLTTPPLPARAALTDPVASYTIAVTLDAAAKTLTGHETITYVNTTADPIHDLVFHLYLNGFRSADSLFLSEQGGQHRGFGFDPQHPGWIEVSSIRLADGTPLDLQELADGTLALASLPDRVAPGDSVTVELDFTAQLPRVFARTGYLDDFFMVGQWFPKLGVWQDGAWNAYPFHANAEFYADFGVYDVAITLPTGYVTGGTGLPTAETDNGDGTQTVYYHAEDVIDFAWTASPNFRAATRQVGDVEVLYLCLPEHDWSVERALDAAEAAVQSYGTWYGPYPYSRLTIVDVPDGGDGAGGMEYPTLVTAGVMSQFGVNALVRTGADRSLELVVAHEVAHQWWQSVVAFNEAEEPWLDEGFADYSTVRLAALQYGAESSVLDAGSLRMGYLDSRRMEYVAMPGVPMYGAAWEFGMVDYGVAAYSKPALALTTLERTLGEETMTGIMSTFYQRYRFAHPTTEDFRATAIAVSGQDLDWFFDGLVYGAGALDYAVTSVTADSVTVSRRGALVIPTEVAVTFADGSTVIEPWSGEKPEQTWTYSGQPPVQRAEVDPGRKIPLDLNWGDNSLSRLPQLSSWMAVVLRLLYTIQHALLTMGGL